MKGALLSIQSHVVYGHVGNSAAVFPLQRLGREVWPLHTVQFSSHAGRPGVRGRVFDAAAIDECTEGLAAIGVLGRCAGILTGYLGSAATGEAALRAVARVRAVRPDAAHVCDPVIGDVGAGVYVAKDVAEFFRARALAHATVITPNHFELEFLAGRPIRDIAALRNAFAALRGRGPQVVLATSLALDDTPAHALDLAVADATGAWRLRTPKIDANYSGAGDLTAALFAHFWLRDRSAPDALASTAAAVYAVVDATNRLGEEELALVQAQDALVAPPRAFACAPL